MRMPKKEVKAVYDQELEAIMEKLGVLGKLKGGEFKCKFCETKITVDNIHSFFPKAGELVFICDKEECIKRLLKHLRKGEVSL